MKIFSRISAGRDAKRLGGTFESLLVEFSDTFRRLHDRVKTHFDRGGRALFFEVLVRAMDEVEVGECR